MTQTVIHIHTPSPKGKPASIKTPAKESSLVIVEGEPGSGKSVVAAATALFTAELGHTVLWIDSLGGVFHSTKRPNIEAVRPKSREFSADEFIEAAKGKTLVVIDHASLNTRRELVAEAIRLMLIPLSQHLD